MADKGADKTEKPTPHSLREARKKGDVAKSRDLGITFGFLFGALLLWLLFDYAAERFTRVMLLAFEVAPLDFEEALIGLGQEAISALLVISAAILIPLAVFHMFVEFMQTGPIMTIEKMKPKMSHLNPVEGLKRMFGADNLVELAKSVVKTGVLAFITIMVVKSVMADLTLLSFGEPLVLLDALSYLALRVFGWTCLAFILMVSVDVAWSHHSFTKKMMMSRRDIKQEHKDNEGDPLIKSTRRQLAHEWSQEGASKAAKDANVLVVNPVHVAIAILYDPETTKVPVIIGRAEDDMALAMREAAAEAGTPVLRNEQLARALLAADTEDDIVPREFFNIVAEVILWARKSRERIELERNPSFFRPVEEDDEEQQEPPGEDLTHYGLPEGPAGHYPAHLRPVGSHVSSTP